MKILTINVQTRKWLTMQKLRRCTIMQNLITQTRKCSIIHWWNSYNVEDYDRPKVPYVWTIWLRPRQKGAYRLFFFTKTEKMPQTLWPIRHSTSFKKWKTYGIIFNACIIYIRFLINVHVISSDSAWLNKQYQTNVIII